MATVVATLTVNPAFLQEIKDDNTELRRLLACTAGMFDAAAVRSMAAALETLGRLRDQLAMHFALEEAYGYFEEPLSAAPRLAQQAETLRNEHRELFIEIRDLVDAACDGFGQRSIFDEVGCRFQAFHDRLREHERRENELILAAFHDDVGVGD